MDFRCWKFIKPIDINVLTVKDFYLNEMEDPFFY